MKKTSIILLTFISLIACKASIHKSTEVNTTTNQTFINAFSKKYYDTGVLLLTQKNGESTLFKAGYSNVSIKTKISIDDQFEIGSASKMFTAIAIMQLIENGQLSLKSKVSEFYSSGDIVKLADYNRTNNWDKITIEMLLNHTSGIVDYLNAFDSDEEALKVYGDPEKIYTFNDIIDLVLHFGDAHFIPGSKFEYSNTNYILLGEILSKVSKTPWRTYIEKNLFKKAGLKNTVFGSKMTVKQKEQLITGYYGNKITNMPYTLAGSAGSIVSNASDLQKFISYWGEGKFYKNPKTFETQISSGIHNMYPGVDAVKYALGVIKFGDTVGHGGQTFGFQSYLALNPSTKETYIVLINNAKAQSFELIMGLLALEAKKKLLTK